MVLCGIPGFGRCRWDGTMTARSQAELRARLCRRSKQSFDNPTRRALATALRIFGEAHLAQSNQASPVSANPATWRANDLLVPVSLLMAVSSEVSVVSAMAARLSVAPHKRHEFRGDVLRISGAAAIPTQQYFLAA